jgi:hypothetical protein
MIRLFVEGVGLCGPGLDGWSASAPILSGAAAYVPAPAALPAINLLPANERRRAPATVKLALAVGAAACAAALRSPADLPAIFTSSGGDGETIHEILSVLASAQREPSPTRFHNSVHNAPAGYWGIATGAVAPTTSLCAHDGSFAAGLLEAAAQAVEGAVLLIAYDVPYPSPLAAVRPVGGLFGVALVLAPVATPAAFAQLDLDLQPGNHSSPAQPQLEALRADIPAARSLPLLEALAGGRIAALTLDYLPGLNLAIRTAPLP